MKLKSIGALFILAVLFFYAGCGNSNNFGPSGQAGNGAGQSTQGLTFRIEVPANVPGASTVAADDQGRGVAAILKLSLIHI